MAGARFVSPTLLDVLERDLIGEFQFTVQFQRWSFHQRVVVRRSGESGAQFSTLPRNSGFTGSVTPTANLPPTVPASPRAIAHRSAAEPPSLPIHSSERELTMVNVVEEPLVIPAVGPLNTQLDSTELRVVPTRSTVPASEPALRRAGVHLEEELSDSWTGGRRLSLMSDGVPIVPRVVEEEEPPTLPASSNEVRVVHQVEVVAMDVGDTETLVSERSRFGR